MKFRRRPSPQAPTLLAEAVGIAAADLVDQLQALCVRLGRAEDRVRRLTEEGLQRQEGDGGGES